MRIRTFCVRFRTLNTTKNTKPPSKGQNYLFLIFDFITFRLFNQTVTKFCLYKYKATKYFRHKLEFLRQKFRVIGNQGVRMKITDEVPSLTLVTHPYPSQEGIFSKRNFRREVHPNCFIFKKSEVHEDMKVIFCFLYMRRRKINSPRRISKTLRCLK